MGTQMTRIQQINMDFNSSLCENPLRSAKSVSSVFLLLSDLVLLKPPL